MSGEIPIRRIGKLQLRRPPDRILDRGIDHAAAGDQQLLRQHEGIEHLHRLVLIRLLKHRGHGVRDAEEALALEQRPPHLQPSDDAGRGAQQTQNNRQDVPPAK